MPTLTELFPHLPREDTRWFRGALVAGACVVVALATARLFPLAVVAASLLIPLIVVIYLYDVDLYEDAPIIAVAATVAAGAAGGILVGLLARLVSDSGTGDLAASDLHRLLLNGLAWQLLALTLMLAGPLSLLPYRRFNDVLDGATFGAVSAVAFAGTRTLVESGSLFTGGLRPPGSVGPWITQLLGLGIAVPLLSAGAIGGVAAAFWLHYRSLPRSRHGLGLLGRPGVALITAAALLVAAGVVQVYLTTSTALACLAALAVAALGWLRIAIHVGLLQEAGEGPIGPPVACANCGQVTPVHSFCANCGIALRALPKEGPRASPRLLTRGGTS